MTLGQKRNNMQQYAAMHDENARKSAMIVITRLHFWAAVALVR
jgi:hypothetical protein